MEDVVGEDQKKHQYIIHIARNTAYCFGYEEISTPIMENTEIFRRTLGPDSDIVNKEMFTFQSRSGKSLTLRPEGTAGIARHFLTEKKQDQLPLRYLYQGPLFRYERPQKGRLRQFHTVGVELLGEESTRGDAECLSLAWLFLKNLGVQKKIQLEINSIGDKESRKKYTDAFITYIKPLKKNLSENSQKRLKKNPLRILDSREEEDKEIIQSAPSIEDFLNTRSKKFFKEITQSLNDLDIPWKHNPLLVRGLDYYSHCVFEFKSDSQQMGTQNTVLAGGRYDPLIETMAGGGERTHGVGWGAGLERLGLLVTLPEHVSSKKRPVTLVPLGEEAENLAVKLAWTLRQSGLFVFHPRPSNLKKKMKKASQINSSHALIFGPEEIKKQVLSLKNLDTGEQHSLPISEALTTLKSTLKKEDIPF